MTTALIKYPGSGTYGMPNPLDISNWRAIREDDNTNLYVVLGDCDSFNIQGMTKDEFFALVASGKSRFRRYTYNSNRFVCPYCFGSGKSDWVNNIIKKAPRDQYIRHFVRKNKTTPRELMGRDYKDYIVSEPELEDSEEICSKCKGTGLNMFRDLMDEAPF